jgi:2,4-dienoyl-CoA reductase-like NADH-dependent reductase (Old Yellow Enzyme family)
MDEGGWKPDGASSLAFDAGYTVPNELSLSGIAQVVQSFASAAQRAGEAGYEWIEVHGAHGYLLHSFNSPVSNTRTDAYGGSLEGRCRITREVAQAIRRVWPDNRVLAFRLSFTDWVEGGWSTGDTVQLARWLKEDGVDLIDVSSGGGVPRPRIPVGPGYQVPGAASVRQGAAIPVAAVGLIDKAEQAELIIREGNADVVMLAREMLRDPYWPLRAAVELQRSEAARMPVQYNSAWGHLGAFNFDPITAPRITESGIDRVDGARRNTLV